MFYFLTSQTVKSIFYFIELYTKYIFFYNINIKNINSAFVTKIKQYFSHFKCRYIF